MAIKELKTRIALKYDLYSAWTTAPGKDLVLLKGELGICEIPAVNGDSRVAPTVLFKVGDGTHTFENLPWASAKAADVYSWAKASDVEVDGKTIKFIGGAIDTDGKKIDKVITLNFATPEEVEAVRSGLDSRITAIENSIGNGGTVANDIADLKTRMGTAEGNIDTLESTKLDKNTYETYIDGKSMSDAELKKYAEDEADAAETDANSYTDTQVAGLKTTLEAADAALGGRIDGVSNRVAAIEGDEGTIAKGDAATLEAAKAYADGLAVNYDAAGSAATAKSEAIAAANTYTDDEVDKLEAEDLRLAGLINGNTTAISTVRTDFEAADLAINNKIGTAADSKDVATVYGAIAKAQADAEANAATTAQGKVDALANGQVSVNKEAIEKNAGEITRVEGLVTAEAKAREDADNAIDERLVAVEAFFETAEGETLDSALDTLKEIQDYLNGDGDATGSILSRVSQAETDIDNLEKEFNTDTGRVKVAEGKIAALEAKDTELTSADAALGQRIDAIVGNEGPITTGDAATLASAKSYTDGRETLIRSELKTAYEAYADQAEADAITAANSYTDSKVSDLSAKNTEIEGKVTTLQNIVDGYTDKGSIKTAIDAAKQQADKGVEDAGKAQAAADAAQGTADTVKAVVENKTTGLAATKVIADRADAKSVANAGRLDTAEGEIDAIQAIVSTGADSNANLRSAITSLQTLTGDANKGNEALYQELTRVAGLVDNTTTGLAATKAIADKNKTDISTLSGKVTAIENDYVKASDLVGDFYVFNCGTSTTVTHVVPEN